MIGKIRKRHYFVTGTDTGVGKTFVTAALLAKLSATGLRVFGLKPVAAGAALRDGVLCNEDALALMNASSVKLSYQQVNPVLLEQAVAPHIAAANEGRSLSVARLSGFCRGALTTPHDVVLIEGAGGWLVPLNSVETLADLATELSAPVILVVGLRLGCINHALLTVESIQRSGLLLAGWIANAGCAEPMVAMAANLDTLQARINAPLLGVLPRADRPDSVAVLQALDVSPLLTAVD
jgi:dethiobiotin synthetase